MFFSVISPSKLSANEWVSEWVSEWKTRANAWMRAWQVSEWVRERTFECENRHIYRVFNAGFSAALPAMSECMTEWVNEWEAEWSEQRRGVWVSGEWVNEETSGELATNRATQKGSLPKAQISAQVSEREWVEYDWGTYIASLRSSLHYSSTCQSRSLSTPNRRQMGPPTPIVSHT